MSTTLLCSFCERSEHEVRKLVAGGGGGHICDECVAIAARIMEESDSPADPGLWRRLVAAAKRLLRPRVRLQASSV